MADFDRIAAEVYQNRTYHEQQIKELIAPGGICTIDDFFRNLNEQISEINAEITPSKSQLTTADFKGIFQAFEKYPSNLQKPKKANARDPNRTLSVSRVHSIIDISAGNQNMNVALSPTRILWDKGPSEAEIYKHFRNFKHSINKLLQELQHKDLETEYIKKLYKLNAFAKDIEKLCGVEYPDIQEAFSNEEAEALRRLVVNLEKAIYINENRNLFQEDHSIQQSGVNLENVLELLTCWLDSIGHYKGI